ncbi:cilia- and flagella-associated protein 100-like [Colossoma macropomum]|uniref:cilia- and flagella-associated protein 100-like n=1 Tax=Colossoma macropomum TaxID=42526 RepID=UPI001864F6F2|nr:cilia- and flagella-associated protein 100-like [Colossoma macropomum]
MLRTMEEPSTDKYKPCHTTVSDGHYTLKMPSLKKGTTEEDAKSSPDFVQLKARNNSAFIGEDDRKPKNPFLLPMDVEIFKKREEDALISQQEKAFLRSLPTPMKTTYLSRLRCRSAPVRSTVEDSVLETEKSRRNRTMWAVVDNKDHCQKEKSITDYLIKQREAFLLQYSLSVKRETIHKLKKEMETEQHRLNLFEKQLQEVEVAFEKFLNENDQNSVEAVNLAEKETMVKMEKTAEIKKVTAQMMTIKSEISKYQETLTKYQTCKKFLMAVAPPQWHEEQNQKREQKREAKRKERMKEMELNPTFLSPNIKGTENGDPRIGKATQTRRLSTCSRKQSVIQERRSSTVSMANEDFESSDNDEEPALCFSDPKEMLSILTELEEQNLSYIQNFQETEEAMDVIRKAAQHSQDKMNHEIHLLQQQIEIMQATIQREREKVLELELKSKIFSYGEYSADKQDHMLELLHRNVREVYRACLGELDCNISTLHMLACIENKVVDVLEHLEMMPPEKVDFVRSLRDKEKRIKIREEKAQLKKQHQEARLKLAMERATSDSKKRMGRKLMPRSEPLEIKKKNELHVMTTKEQKDHLYFFT